VEEKENLLGGMGMEKEFRAALFVAERQSILAIPSLLNDRGCCGRVVKHIVGSF
jgi:hypothetical protein